MAGDLSQGSGNHGLRQTLKARKAEEPASPSSARTVLPSPIYEDPGPCLINAGDPVLEKRENNYLKVEGGVWAGVQTVPGAVMNEVESQPGPKDKSNAEPGRRRAPSPMPVDISDTEVVVASPTLRTCVPRTASRVPAFEPLEF